MGNLTYSIGSVEVLWVSMEDVFVVAEGSVLVTLVLGTISVSHR